MFGFALSLLICVFSAAAFAGEGPFTAKIFAEDSAKQKLLFTYTGENQQNGDVRVDLHTYKGLDGQVVEIETTEFVKAGASEKFKSYHVSQKQLGAEGSIELQDGKLKFSYTKDGSTKTATETATDDFIVGPSISMHLRAHWEQILKGDKVKVRFGVPDRAETVGFEFFKDHEETIDGKKTLAIKMKPSSFIIAALVKPLMFFYTPDGATLVEVHGRTQVKEKVDGKYKDLDAVTTFDYPVEAPQASPSPSVGNSK